MTSENKKEFYVEIYSSWIAGCQIVLMFLLSPYQNIFFMSTASSFKMLYLIGPGGLVNRGFINFRKMVWMTTIHVLRFRMKHQKSSEIIYSFQIISEDFYSLIFNLGMHIILIYAIFWKFAYLRFTGYAEYIRFSHK